MWAILPSVIVTLIALPSLTLIFTYDDLVRKPLLTVKVIGRQWYWQYRMKESVDFYLRKETEKLLLADFRSKPLFLKNSFFFSIFHQKK